MKSSSRRVEDVAREIVHAHEAFAKWRSTPFAERAAILRKTAELLRKFADEIAATLTREQGKPLKEAKIEVERTADTFDLYASDDMGALVDTVDVPGKTARVVRRPLGACAAIVPWNFPLTLMANKLVPALATGNTVVVKPSPTTPLAAQRCIELLYEAGLPEGVVEIVIGGADVGAALIEHPLIRKVSFTGSTATGKAIMALAAKGLKRLTLELGGNDAMIVCEDADVVGAARAAAVGRFFNAGQACIATKRIYVHRSKYDEFVERVSERAAKLPLGDGFDPNVRMGPLHSQPQRESVEGFVRDALERGAKTAAGGKRPDKGKGYFFEPTVLVDVPDNARLIREECFGPVLPGDGVRFDRRSVRARERDGVRARLIDLDERCGVARARSARARCRIYLDQRHRDRLRSVAVRRRKGERFWKRAWHRGPQRVPRAQIRRRRRRRAWLIPLSGFSISAGIRRKNHARRR